MKRNHGFSYQFRLFLSNTVTALANGVARVKRLWRRLNGIGRGLVCGTAALLLTGVILLCTLPGAQQAAKSGPEPTPIDDVALQSIDIEVTPSPTPVPTPTPTPDPTLYRDMPDDPRVAELQNRLMELGYMDSDEATLHFGPATEYAVELFQRQHDLAQDGIAGIETLGIVYSDDALKYTLKEGYKGTDVDKFQRQLKDLGYLSKTTGYYGTETIQAVKDFQRENGLAVDGLAGVKTFNLINSDDAKQSPSLAKAARTKANISKMISTAKSKLGCKYVLGAEGPNTFDCSGLVYYCLKEAGSNRRRLNAAGYSGVSDWEKISYSNLKRGDLLMFWSSTAKTRIGHIGIYMGGGEMIDASSSNGKVVRRAMNTSYWKSVFYCGRRPW